MKWDRYWVAGVVAAVALCISAGRAQEPAAHIPEAHGTTLAGTAASLPEAVNGKSGVLVLGFSKVSQRQVAAWGKRLTADYRQSASVVYFQVPMLGGAPRLLRGMIVRQMSGSVPEEERSHFLPLVDNEAAWRTVARYAKPDDAYVLLVDGEGVIRWQIEGDATDVAYGALKQGLERLLASQGMR